MNTQPAANDPTMDLEQAAAFMHLGYKAMKELVDSGEVPALSLNQKHTILLREDLITYVREQGRKQADKRRARKQPAAATTTPTTPHHRGRKTAKPNLDAYEVTTAGQRG
jgi:hypothetical protein